MVAGQLRSNVVPLSYPRNRDRAVGRPPRGRRHDVGQPLFYALEIAASEVSQPSDEDPRCEARQHVRVPDGFLQSATQSSFSQDRSGTAQGLRRALARLNIKLKQHTIGCDLGNLVIESAAVWEAGKRVGRGLAVTPLALESASNIATGKACNFRQPRHCFVARLERSKNDQGADTVGAVTQWDREAARRPLVSCPPWAKQICARLPRDRGIAHRRPTRG